MAGSAGVGENSLNVLVSVPTHKRGRVLRAAAPTSSRRACCARTSSATRVQELNDPAVLEQPVLNVEEGLRPDVRHISRMHVHPVHAHAAICERVQVARIPEYVAALRSQGASSTLAAVQSMRKLLSVERNPPIEAVRAAGALQPLVELVRDYMAQPFIAFEAAWALTNVAGGSHDDSKAVADVGAISVATAILRELVAELQRDEARGLRQCYIQVVEQLVWLLGNISGDSVELRNTALEQGCVQAFADLLRWLLSHRDAARASLLRNLAWAGSNCMRGKPSPDIDVVWPLLAELLHVCGIDDADAKTDALWAVSYVSESDEVSSRIVEAGGAAFCRNIVATLSAPQMSIVTPALRAAGNILSGTAESTQALLDAGVVPELLRLVQFGRRGVRKEAAWALSNIAAGTPAQARLLLEHDGIRICADVISAGPADAAKECLWTLANLSSSIADDMVDAMIEHAPKLIEHIVRALESGLPDRMAQVCLELLFALSNSHPAREGGRGVALGAAFRGIREALEEAFQQGDGLGVAREKAQQLLDMLPAGNAAQDVGAALQGGAAPGLHPDDDVQRMKAASSSAPPPHTPAPRHNSDDDEDEDPQPDLDAR